MAAIALWIAEGIRITEISRAIKPKRSCLTVVEYE